MTRSAMEHPVLLSSVRASLPLALAVGLLAAPGFGQPPADKPPGAVPAAPEAPKNSDPKAVAVADQLMQGLGGQPAWDATRYLRFEFAVEREGKILASRSHLWDKANGRYRLEAKTREGDPYVVLTNINTKDGTAYLKGAPLEGEELKKYLQQAFAIWTNDTYWLLMPYKLRDPGVILGYEGEEKSPEGTYDRVTLAFDNVGLTPKDRYWVYVNRDTHLVDRWDYVLKGSNDPPTTFLWKGWHPVGKVMLASERVNTKDATKILVPVLESPATVPDAAFTSLGGAPAAKP